MMKPVSKRNASPALLALLAWLSLGACDNSQTAQSDTLINGTPTDAELADLDANISLSTHFATPNADGKFSTTIDTIFNGSFEDDSGNGYAVEISRKDTAFNAKVGVIQSSDPGDFPINGGANMQGSYQVAEVGKSDGDFREFGEVAVTEGRISLYADFEHGTLHGDSDDLIIDGLFTSNTLTGNAYFKQREADLTGLVGEDRAIGVFHGSDAATAFVGGFLVER
ncbi:hypothetical protein [Planktotalea sp.]|uniref:hypothetical protein n=1 Tax=Planktotalea sp. TaxID=2029877 RepID=UPI003296D678